MTSQVVTINSTHNVSTCKPAMGFSFAAGTTDGPGAFDFKQGKKQKLFPDFSNFRFQRPSAYIQLFL